MSKGIFTTKVRPTYDDLPEVRYHFPNIYLNQAKAIVGDWIIYYEPRRQDSDPSGRYGRQAYFATAKVERIEDDQRLVGHYYAFVSNYLEFEIPVPFKQGGTYMEKALVKEDGSTNKGAFGRAIRLISDDEYQQILRLGFATVVQKTNLDLTIDIEEPAEYSRPIVEQLVRRPFRDAAFAKSVSDAYNFTCATTGLKIINGGGRCEVEAAHIRPVGDKHNDPDSIRNGMALSRTVHWMFDRGLLSLTDDYNILIAKSLIPDPIKGLINPEGRILLPADSKNYPHPQFLRYHREHIFKG